MRSLEFSRNLSIGQYIGTSSYVHRLTPATKYLWLLCLSVPAIAARGPTGALFPLLAALAIGQAAGVRAGFLLRGLKPAVPILALVALMQVLFGWRGDESRVLASVGPFALSARVALNIVMAFVRTFSLMTIIALFTSTSGEGEIARGIEDILSPLAALRFPAHELAFAVAMAFRFIPIVAGELESIVRAQAARGADFGTGRGGPLAKVRAYLPLFVPVTIRALERAEALAEAMEARCYRGREGRSRYVVYDRIRGEKAARGAAVAFCAAAIALDVFFPGIFT
jgi:energy-coupling factor transport system permease protein